jgi:hypothetical protein
VTRPRATRRGLLKALALAPLAALATRADAREYASAAEVLAEIDRLEADLDARMSALAAAVAAAGPLARSMGADHDRHRMTRAALRRRLGLGPSSASPAGPPVSAPRTMAALTALAQELVHAYAEGLPALRDAAAVAALAPQMVDDARHLAVLQMWAEAEEPGA